MTTRITQLSQLDLNGIYSYADYLTWRCDQAVELIKGKIMLMCPAPSLAHQRLSRKLLHPIDSYLMGKTCEVFHAPFDVRFPDRLCADQEVFTVVQPDLCVICDPRKLDSRGCLGAPDWIIEILSRENSKRDIKTKYALYQEHGVLEYWIVYPYEKTIHQFVLGDDKKYQLINMYSCDDQAVPSIFPDLAIDLTQVFQQVGDADNE
ncbi:MAG: Uma2 family endonuclease [Methylococcaceae bacterium]|nr:MAG: Uma2 family endonuclease [Methylococcaceae bacterium]